jgi:soluble lytic murein transglycosylase
MGNVNRWLSDGNYSDDGITLKEIPYPETKTYVQRVLNNYQQYKSLYNSQK